jgi:hypothetical protein
LDGSQKNELSCAIYSVNYCYQEIILTDFFGIEKVKIYRQYIRAPTFSGDEAGYISHYQHSIYKKFSYHPGYRAMGNVYVHCRAHDLFLGYRNNSVITYALQHEQNIQKVW